MQTIEAFFYKNILEIQVIDPAIFTTRNRIVYSRTIKIYQGIDNPIHIVVKNQDQKPANVTGYQIQIEIQDLAKQERVASFTANLINSDKGLGVFVVPKSVVNQLDLRHYHFTTKIIDQIYQESPLYIDDNYGAALPLQVLPAYYPVDVSQTFDGGGADANYQDFGNNIDGGAAATVFAGTDINGGES